MSPPSVRPLGRLALLQVQRVRVGEGPGGGSGPQEVGNETGKQWWKSNL